MLPKMYIAIQDPGSMMPMRDPGSMGLMEDPGSMGLMQGCWGPGTHLQQRVGGPGASALEAGGRHNGGRRPTKWGVEGEAPRHLGHICPSCYTQILRFHPNSKVSPEY